MSRTDAQNGVDITFKQLPVQYCFPSPVKPFWQRHEYEPKVFVHRPTEHNEGELLHSSTSGERKEMDSELELEMN
jgi:hypothetical protein